MLRHLEQQLCAVDVGFVACLCAQSDQRVVQPSAAQVVDAAAVDGERLCQRALSSVERLDADAGDVKEVGREGDVSDVGVAAQCGFVDDDGLDMQPLRFIVFLFGGGGRIRNVLRRCLVLRHSSQFETEIGK